MQAVTSSTTMSADTQEQRAGEAILHFVLHGVLPAGHILALHRELGILVDLSCVSDVPHMCVSQQFTFSELCVLIPLLESFPDYCPYEVLLAYFNNASANVTGEMIEQCRRHLHSVQENGLFEQEMRPVRNVISRTRLKLHEFDIDVTSLLETGYLIRPKPRRARKHREKSTL